jgi:hypothetical protein
MFSPTTLEDSSNAISSQALADGPTPCASQDGRNHDLFGQALAPVSRSQSVALDMAARKVKAMKGISGRISSGSSASESLQQSLANRFRTRLIGDGGTEQPWTLKAMRTPARRRFFALTPSAPSTKGKGSIGWPTPAARDGKDISRSNAFLSQHQRHSPSMATRLLERGAPWRVITAVYCLAMGYPSSWNEVRLKGTETQSYRPAPPSSSKRALKQSTPSPTRTVELVKI